GRREGARGRTPGRGRKTMPSRFDDDGPPAGLQRAHGRGGADAAGDALEHGRRAARLIEPHALVDADIERIPVDDRGVARLIDDYRRAALALNGGGAADHGAAERSARSRRGGERDQRRGGEHEIAEAWM